MPDVSIDADFLNLKGILESDKLGWQVSYASEKENIAIYKKKTDIKIDIIRAEMTFEGIKKEVAFKLISDLNLRRKWDKVLAKLTVI